MVLLKSLKRQLNQFVTPDIEPLSESKINLYSRQPLPTHDESRKEHAEQKAVSPVEVKHGISPFQETYKEAYSHGLEAIYSLETVDIRTIKPISVQQETVVEDDEGTGEKYPVTEDPQLDFDLGSEYRSHIESFTLNEPIHVLNLSQEALKRLRQQGKCVIRDLIGVDWKNLAVTKGMGQGHVDEIIQKLHKYTRKKALDRCYRVDFEAMLRCVIPESSHVKHHMLLDVYNLSSCVSLTPAQTVEIRIQDPFQKQQALLESLEQFRSEDRRAFSSSSMQTICNTFVKPWLRGKGGFCVDYELMDRLENVSAAPLKMYDVMRFMQDVFFDGHFPMRPFLPMSGDQIFFVDLTALNNFIAIEKAALTYFYRDSAKYPLEELSSLLLREFAAKWEGFPEGFVEKVLRTSPRFRVRKSSQEQLVVSLA